MFDLPLFACVTLTCLPGILVIVPRSMRTIVRLARDRMASGQEMPPMPLVIAVSMVQSLILVGIAAAIGTALAHPAGLRAPFFEALAGGQPLWPATRPQLLPSLVFGTVGALIFVAAYYGLFRPGLDAATVRCMEELRCGIGIGGRLLYGGTAEEVLTRWGLMSLFAWLGSLLAGGPQSAIFWGAIVSSGLLFGVGHVPGYLAAGCRKTPMFFALMLGLNLWASLIFGWLFWQYGLLAAMVAHMVFHLVWLPFDLHYYQPLEQVRVP